MGWVSGVFLVLVFLTTTSLSGESRRSLAEIGKRFGEPVSQSSQWSSTNISFYKSEKMLDLTFTHVVKIIRDSDLP